MRKFAFSAIAVLLVIQFSIMTVFASTYEVSNDTDVTEISPIYYTENYEPGMITAMREAGIGLFAIRGYGSYSSAGWNPILSVEGASGSSALRYPTSEPPSVTVGTNSVTAQYSFSYNSSFNSALLFMSGSSNPYFDFQSNDIVFSQDTPDANTFVLNGTLRFTLSSYWTVITGATTASFYTALDPVGIQLLVDGKAYGEVIDITSYTSPFTGAFTSASPAVATVTFNNLKIYGPNVTPELIGFRVYCDSNYSSGSRSFGGGSSIGIVQSNTFSFNTLPAITFAKEATSGDGDLSSILSVLNNLYTKVTSIADFKGFFSELSNGSMKWLSPSGTIDSVNSGVTLGLHFMLRNGLIGLSTNLNSINSSLNHSTDGSWLRLIRNALSFHNADWDFLDSSGGSHASSSRVELINLIRLGFLGLSQNIKDFNSYLEDSTFSWQNYNLDTHELDSAQTLTGQNALFGTAFQSIEENLGRLAYVFASDDEIELRDEADPSVTSFKDAFGGGAKASDIGQMKRTFDDVETMFDSGFDIDDLFDSFNSDSSWLSWFTAETASSLDSTPSVYTVGDDDPYNHYAYKEHLQAVQALRNRGEGE